MTIHRVKIRLKRDLSTNFKSEWSSKIQPFMQKGWATWISAKYLAPNGELLDTILPEVNKYVINFNGADFEIVKEETSSSQGSRSVKKKEAKPKYPVGTILKHISGTYCITIVQYNINKRGIYYSLKKGGYTEKFLNENFQVIPERKTGEFEIGGPDGPGTYDEPCEKTHKKFHQSAQVIKRRARKRKLL